MGLTSLCSKAREMDCCNAGGGCCASNSDGTGTVSVAEKISDELCGYCFTGKPATLIEEATVQGMGCMDVMYSGMCLAVWVWLRYIATLALVYTMHASSSL